MEGDKPVAEAQSKDWKELFLMPNKDDYVIFPLPREPSMIFCKPKMLPIKSDNLLKQERALCEQMNVEK